MIAYFSSIINLKSLISTKMNLTKVALYPTYANRSSSTVELSNVVNPDRTTQVWDALVTDEKTGKKIAMFRCTQMILWPKN